MNRRSFFTAVAVLAAAPFAVLAVQPKEPDNLRQIYRLDKNGCNPQRIRMRQLRKGDLFIASCPEENWTSGVKKCMSAPRQIEMPGIGLTWSVDCE